MSREVSIAYINVYKWRVQIGDHTFVIKAKAIDSERAYFVAYVRFLTLPNQEHSTGEKSSAQDALWSAIGFCWERVEEADNNEVLLAARS